MKEIGPNTTFSRIYRYLLSTEIAVFLFLGIAALAIPGTFGETRDIYSSPLFLVLVALLGLSTAACSARRIKSLHLSVLLVHSGVLLLLAGAIVTSRGFVATVNIYEGTGVDSVYRWDRKEDVPLGMDLEVRRINTEYYPAPVKVGVMERGEKRALLTLRTGESFPLGEYSVKVAELYPQARSLRLDVSRKGTAIGFAYTSGSCSLPADFPYDFRLVAFRNRVVKTMWVDLRLSGESGTIAEGRAEVNSPFQWRGLCFYHVRTDRDRFGRRYAGIQIVRDPGRPLVFSALLIVCIGVLLSFARRIYRKG